MLKKTSIILSLILIIAFLIPISSLSATTDKDTISSLLRDTAGTEGAGYYDGTHATSLSIIIADVIKLALSLLGVVFIVLMIYGGYTWMTAAGNDEQIAKAKKTMTAAVVGMTIVLLSYAITVFVTRYLTASVTESGSGANTGTIR